MKQCETCGKELKNSEIFTRNGKIQCESCAFDESNNKAEIKNLEVQSNDTIYKNIMSNIIQSKVVFICIAVIGIIATIVFFYQYQTAKENAELAVKTAASYYKMYGFGNANASGYITYSNAMSHAKGYLAGGIISLIISVFSTINAVRLSKKSNENN